MFTHRTKLAATAQSLMLAFAATQFSSAQTSSPVSSTITNHYLVAYRNGTIPADAEASTSLAGAQLVKRHSSLGIATVQANGTASDEANVKHLAAQANVEFVVHDRLVHAHQIVVSAIQGAKQQLHTNVARPNTPATSHGTVSINALALQTPDSFYDTPQGWAVRAVGGYGKHMAGGPATGPWDVTTGTGVRIAILDSGVDAHHPDIAPNLVFNLSEVNQTPHTGLPSACDDGTPQDQQGHGTWSASLAAGAMGAATGKVVGVAPTASILNIKVLERMPDTTVTGGTVAQQCASGQASGMLSWVIQGIDDAVAQHADIISMSLGSMIDLETGDGAGLKALFDRAAYAATQAGAVLIAAAGNDGFDYTNPRYIELPAMARSVLAIVASTNPACAENIAPGAACVAGAAALPYYSNFGAPMNALSAPGGNLPAGGDYTVSGWVRGACSTSGCFGLGDAQYVQAMGTSASAPLAAGVAALLRAANPGWDAAKIVAALRSSAAVTSAMPYGQINAAAALGLGN